MDSPLDLGAKRNPFAFRRNLNQTSYDQNAIYQFIDQYATCTIGVEIDGTVQMVPTLYARVGDTILLHGSRASSIIRASLKNQKITILINATSALVLPDSIFDHTMDYKSVLIAGSPKEIVNSALKLKALKQLTDFILPGRWDQVRAPNEKEMRQTVIIEVAIEDALLKFSETELSQLESKTTWTAKINLGNRSFDVKNAPSPAPSPATDPAKIAEKFLR
ncbi:pyridoxamine 5'-phosphate oxidase family protein [Acidithrix ferrooxidans]|uniref:Pyridoxamine 5'-phosphate oxidase n=1 Tax=Acidithrix ferrooxidans TaxID=1280514 RepID=A0A0D8HMD3_9ACTN|nr:pyridoxamine 5'-phosphate oxidase family protein [Acidithrix ferrooxidans]KJF19004.1 pyridoxamine 5'-phosphate oxidase [Acidithrix ferrooxidans]